MPIVVDATGTLSNTGTSTTSLSYTGITVGTGLLNGALVAWFVADAQITGLTATWDNGGTNQAMTQIAQLSDATSITVSTLFGLINPTAGNKTLLFSWTTSVRGTAIAQSYTGVLQTGGATTWPNSNTNHNTTTSASIAITSAINNLPLACLATNSATANTVSAQNQTIIFTAGTRSKGGGQTAAGAASVTFSATIGATGGWNYCGCDMVAAPIIPVFGATEIPSSHWRTNIVRSYRVR